jgi:signal transduction histidine kinase
MKPLSVVDLFAIVVAERLVELVARVSRAAASVTEHSAMRTLRATEECARAALIELRVLVQALEAGGPRRMLAREVHDLVGHGLSLVAMHAAVGAARMCSGAEPVEDAVRRIRELTQHTESELIMLLILLRAPRDDAPDGASVRERVEALVAAAHRAGQPVDLDLADVEPTEDVGDAIVDVVREGLTNARKHAGVAPVTIAMRAEDDAIHVVVENERGEPLVGPGSQTGLASLRERVAAAGGRLDAGPTASSGWRIRCVF